MRIRRQIVVQKEKMEYNMNTGIISASIFSGASLVSMAISIDSTGAGKFLMLFSCLVFLVSLIVIIFITQFPVRK